VELNIIADIGFVGFPNAGKSSLLKVLTNARPEVAPYPFTTKTPHLGVLTVGEEDIVLADIPGILEGASTGVGLGIKFLRHISRTKGLAFLIDLSQPDFLGHFDILLKEVGEFSPELARRKRVLIGTKIDLLESLRPLEELQRKYPDEQVVGISSLTRKGLDALIQIFLRLAKEEE